MNEKYITLTKVFKASDGEEYCIIKGIHDSIIRAINYKYIDHNGVLTKKLNGFDMYVSTLDNTVSGIINRIENQIRFRKASKDIDMNNPEQVRLFLKDFYNIG